MTTPFINSSSLLPISGGRKINFDNLMNSNNMFIIAIKDNNKKWNYTVNIFKNDHIFKFIFHQNDFKASSHKKRIAKMISTILN
jgi:hypothetical protein